jgi:type VI secretion system secreted protein Hcp
VAQKDIFLKIEAIDGESQDSKHKGEIDLDSFSWGATNSGTAATGGGGGAGRVAMQDFHFVTHVQKSSPKLMLACSNGEHIKKATLTVRKAGKEQQEYLIITFSDVLISSYQVGCSSANELIPSEQISFNFSKIEYEYKEQKADGTLGGSIKNWYNQKENKGG